MEKHNKSRSFLTGCEWKSLGIQMSQGHDFWNITKDVQVCEDGASQKRSTWATVTLLIHLAVKFDVTATGEVKLREPLRVF